jgi:hypothetical protein
MAAVITLPRISLALLYFLVPRDHLLFRRINTD